MNSTNRNAFHPDAILSTLENIGAIDWNQFDTPVKVKPGEVICLPYVNLEEQHAADVTQHQ